MVNPYVRVSHLSAHLTAAVFDLVDTPKMVVGERKYVILHEYDLVKECLADPLRFSSLIPRLRTPDENILAVEKMAPNFEGLSNFVKGTRVWAINTDGALHASIRKAMPKHLMIYNQVREDYAGEMREAIETHLRECAQNGSLNVLTMVKRVSMDMCCLVLGLENISRSQKEEFMKWASGLARTGDLQPQEVLENIHYFKRGTEYFQSEIIRVRNALAHRAAASRLKEQKAREDVVNERKQVEKSGGRTREEENGSGERDRRDRRDRREGVIEIMIKDGSLSDDILCNNFLMWLLGGFHNPVNLACLSIGRLLQDPEQLTRFRHSHASAQDKITVLRQCVSEMGRASPPSETLVRVAQCPMKLGTHTLNKDDGVILDIRRANEGACPRGEIVDVSRPLQESGSQLTFGYGPHKCLGFSFGQLQAELIIERLLLVKGGSPDLSGIGLKSFRMESAGSFKETIMLEVAF